MNKILTATLAAVIAGSTMGVATAADAQSRHDRQDRREQRDDRRDNRQDRREFRQDQRQDRQEFRQDQRQYARWQQSQRRYNAPRYVAPRGYAARQWSYGQRMPVQYRDSRYIVSDYSRYGLRQPPRGYQYVRSGNDVVLAAVATGLITAVIASMFN